MGYKLIISRDAHRDVDEIVGHITHERKAHRPPRSFLTMWTKSYRSLVENPRLFALCQDARLQLSVYIN